MTATEPQYERPNCQRRLTYTLMVMVILLTIVQAITLAILLTRYSAPAQVPTRPSEQHQTTVPTEPPEEDRTTNVFRRVDVLHQEVMVNRDTSSRLGIIPWAKDEDNVKQPLIVQQDHLKVREGKDGHYFLYAQVTLQHDKTMNGSFIGRVMLDDRTLLEAYLTRGSDGPFTTGFLGKRVSLHSGATLPHHHIRESTCFSSSNTTYYQWAQLNV
ncbi:hypothetical protein JZ751_027506 [Albula glossodonta]|uniref:TNF family profile domain-containing protein n=1 Tax=Albula glossodonta TaxID=121402 RepID=A0A8T2NBW0_9TELE|nr:hypothetical protein JZ751_027506 [Albula glossodonta]